MEYNYLARTPTRNKSSNAFQGSHFLCFTIFISCMFQGHVCASPQQSQQCTPDENEIPSPNAECKLYLGESSIPNSGLGMYTAVDMKQGEAVGWPEFLIYVQTKETKKSLIDDYFWYGWSYIPDARNPGVLMPNLGMAVNGHMKLHNVNCGNSKVSIDDAGLHRNTSPAAGAISMYHNLTFYMTKDTSAGSELFADYGTRYFLDRVNTMGFAPLQENYEAADTIASKTMDFFHTYHDKIAPDVKQRIWKMLRDQMVDNERNRAALPQTVKDIDEVSKVGSAKVSLNTVRSQEWLENNAMCVDNLRPGQSINAQAGRGAFAARFLKKGNRIAPVPLIHVADEVLQIHANLRDRDTLAVVSDETAPMGYELLLNYCFGHSNSTIRLFPYTSWVYYINHDRINPNAEIRWSTSDAHKSRWLELPVEDLLKQPYAGLILDVVATRDILPGEEVFIDYGEHWEEAWTNHAKARHPTKHFVDRFHIPSFAFNEHEPVKTVFEQQEASYPENILITCYHVFSSRNEASGAARDVDLDEVERLNAQLIMEIAFQWSDADLQYPEHNFHPCQILSRDFSTEHDEGTYVVAISNPYPGKFRFVKEVPRRGIRLADKRFTTDNFLPNAFRHFIGMPDEIFPDAWMDIK